MNRSITPLALLIAGTGILATVLWIGLQRSQSPPQLDLPGVQILETPVTLPDVELVDHRNEPFTPRRFAGRWTLGFFGYTHCPDVCPTTLAVLRHTLERFSDASTGAPRVQAVFFTVDPFRDTPAILRDRVNSLGGKMIAVTGRPAHVRRLAEALNVYYDYEDPAGERIFRNVTEPPPVDDYLVNHYASVLLIDPRGRLVADIAPPHPPDRIVAVLDAFIDTDDSK